MNRKPQTKPRPVSIVQPSKATASLFSESEALAIALVSDHLDADGKPNNPSLRVALDRVVQDCEVISLALESEDTERADMAYAVHRIARRLEWLGKLVHRVERIAVQANGGST